MAKAKPATAPDPSPVEAALDGVLAAAVPQDPSPLPPPPPGEAVPAVTSPDWTPFLLAKLADDELYDGLPTVEGLRRLCEEFYGEVLESVTRVVQPPTPDNDHHACCEHHLVVRCHADGQVKKFSGAADVFAESAEDRAFGWRYSTACCETRAEGRAYRRALRLRHVCAAEELSRVPDDQQGLDGAMNDRQRGFLDMMCQRNDIDAWAFVNAGKKTYATLADVPYQTAVRMMTQLNAYQQRRADIPAKLRGYKKGWLKAAGG